MSATDRSRGRNTDALLVIFAVTGGAWAWTLQLWLSWSLGDPLCFLEDGELAVASLGGGALWVGIGLAAGVVAFAALVVSYRMWRGGAGTEPKHEPDESGGGGPRRFLAYTGLALNGLFLLAILMGTTAPIWLRPCV